MLGFSTKIISLLPVFYPCTDVEKPDAPHTKQAIICALEKAGINWKNSLVNFTADGAAVHFGCRAGVLKLLQNYLNHLIGIHCNSYRLELALKDAAKQIPYINTLEEILQSLYRFYHNSANTWNGLQEAGKALSVYIHVLRPPRLNTKTMVSELYTEIGLLWWNISPRVLFLQTQTMQPKPKDF